MPEVARNDAYLILIISKNSTLPFLNFKPFIVPIPADVERPSFGVTCPSSDIKRYADSAKNYTTVNWPPVIATDNSGMATNVTQRGVPTGNKFYEGRHEVIYNASDAAGNYRICRFHVTVESKLSTLILSNGRSSCKTNGYCLLLTKKLQVRKAFCDRFRYR